MKRVRVLLIVPLLLLGLVTVTSSVAASPCAINPYGLIGDKWWRTGGEGGPLGCALEAEHDVPGRRGRLQTFQWGQITYSPDQGPKMVVATWFVGTHVVVDWGPTDPLSYDFFIVRWDLNGRNVGQTDIKGGPRNSGHFEFDTGTGWSSVIVEGCDDGTWGSTCRQGWTTAVGANVAPPGPVWIAPWSTADPAHAFDGLGERTRATAEQLACTRMLNPWEPRVGEDTSLIMSAHLELARRFGWGYRCRAQLPSIELVNRALLSAQPHPTGSSFSTPFCSRDGDYDTFLKGLMVVVYRYWDMLWLETRNKILNTLLSERGPHSGDDEKTPVCGLIDLPESENHRLLIESARYLANQKLWEATRDPQYDNVGNGMREYLLRNLQNFAKFDFMEYNARPYQRYSMHGLLNLYDFAWDPKIRDAAQVVLDYTTSKFALSSNELRRAGPFRRLTPRSDQQLQWYYGGANDPQTAFFLLWTGLSRNVGYTIPDWYVGESVIAGLSNYRPPASAIRNAMVKGTTQQTFFHGYRPRLSYSPDDPAPGIEIYSSSPSFLISAGGVWLPTGYGRDEWYDRFGTNENYGVVQSTTLMPSRNHPWAGMNRDNFIRFDGYSNQSPAGRGNVNTCVQGGFACGVRLQVPQFWLDCAEKDPYGVWQFLNLNTAACGWQGFSLAIHGTPNGDLGNTGFWYAMESSAMSFADFRNRTVWANYASMPDQLNPTQEYTFHTPDGHHYTFRTRPPNGQNTEALVTWVDGKYIGDFNARPLVEGTSMNGPGHEGLIDIGDRVLDYRDPMNPVIQYR